MRKEELKRMIKRLRTNSRDSLKKITNGRFDKYAKKAITPRKNNLVKRMVSIPDFEAIGFPLIILYTIETDCKPVKLISNEHVNNCYRANGNNIYIIEAMFRYAHEAEEYEDSLRNEALSFNKHYIVNDIMREEFIPE